MTIKRQISSWETLPVLINADTTAVLLSTSKQIVTKLARNGQLPGAKKIGRFWYVSKAELKNFMETERN